MSPKRNAGRALARQAASQLHLHFHSYFDNLTSTSIPHSEALLVAMETTSVEPCNRTKTSESAIEYNDEAVAYLVFSHADQPKSLRDVPIFAGPPFDIGRAEIKQVLDVQEQTISNHHLRFHCVVYGDDLEGPVLPMVYVRVLSSHPVRLVSRDDGRKSARSLSNTNADFLLSDGDSIDVTNKIRIEYDARQDAPRLPPLTATEMSERSQFSSLFKILSRKLGAGGYASVYLAEDAISRQQVACKVIKYRKGRFNALSLRDGAIQQRSKSQSTNVLQDETYVSRKRFTEVQREIEILQRVDHPNITRLERVFWADANVYIFQELISAGDLLSYLQLKSGVEAPEAAVITFQLLKAVEYRKNRVSVRIRAVTLAKNYHSPLK